MKQDQVKHGITVLEILALWFLGLACASAPVPDTATEDPQLWISHLGQVLGHKLESLNIGYYDYDELYVYVPDECKIDDLHLYTINSKLFRFKKATRTRNFDDYIDYIIEQKGNIPSTDKSSNVAIASDECMVEYENDDNDSYIWSLYFDIFIYDTHGYDRHGRWGNREYLEVRYDIQFKIKEFSYMSYLSNGYIEEGLYFYKTYPKLLEAERVYKKYGINNSNTVQLGVDIETKALTINNIYCITNLLHFGTNERVGYSCFIVIGGIGHMYSGEPDILIKNYNRNDDYDDLKNPILKYIGLTETIGDDGAVYKLPTFQFLDILKDN
jgi:hypothetical protein